MLGFFFAAVVVLSLYQRTAINGFRWIQVHYDAHINADKYHNKNTFYKDSFLRTLFCITFTECKDCIVALWLNIS